MQINAILGWICATALMTLAIPAQIKSYSATLPRQKLLLIVGRVEPEDGYKIPARATVRLYRSTEMVKELLTEEDGRFEFRDVMPGYYRVIANLDGFMPAEDAVELGEGGLTVYRVLLRLKPDATTVAIPEAPTVSVAELKIPKKAWQEYQRAEEKLRDNKYPQAIQHFNKALELCPAFLKAWLGLGVAGRCIGDAAGSETAFRQALRLDPRNLMARLNLAELCAATGRPHEAKAILEETVDIHPGEGEPHLNLGKLHYQAGRLDEAEAEWLQAARLAHTRPEVHLLLARIYQQRRQLSKFRAELEAYLEKAPESPQSQKIRQTLAAAKEK
jgi:Flp pilus assembly protein TadD